MTSGQVAALAALGAFHGLNPAMGWLFAVARGMQERSRWAMLRSLPPIAAGTVAVVGGALLVGFGLWRLLSDRHFRWAGMRLSLRQLAGWSFLVSSAHGAGLMLLPVLATDATVGSLGHAGHPSGASTAGTPAAALFGLGAAGVHTVAMFAVMAGVALLVHDVLGLAVLRRAWFNVDRLWAAVLVTAGALTIAATL